MPVEELSINYKGKKIRVENRWFSGARLYIDDVCRDKTFRLISTNSNKPVLYTSIETDNGPEIIEAFIVAIETTKIKIHANGEFIAGQSF